MKELCGCARVVCAAEGTKRRLLRAVGQRRRRSSSDHHCHSDVKQFVFKGDHPCESATYGRTWRADVRCGKHEQRRCRCLGDFLAGGACCTARPVSPPPMAKPGASSDASSAARPKVDAKARGSIRPPEPKGPPPKRPQGSNRPAGTQETTTKAQNQSRKQRQNPQTLRVTTMFKTKSEWKEMRHRNGVAHVRRMMPRGSVGQQIVGKQGPTCSTCTVRRRISTKAAQAYAASKRQRHDLQQPKSNSGQKKLS